MEVLDRRSHHELDARVVFAKLQHVRRGYGVGPLKREERIMSRFIVTYFNISKICLHIVDAPRLSAFDCRCRRSVTSAW